MTRTTGSVAVLLVLLSSPGETQSLEVGPLASVGFTTSSAFDSVAAGLDGAAIRGGFTWGGQVAWRFQPRWAAELSFTQQRTGFELDVAGQTVDLFELQIGQLHASAAFLMRGEETRVRPYLLVGAGVAFLNGPGLDTDARFSWAGGVGVEAFPTERFGVRVQGRFLQTRLGGDEGDPACPPTAFCSSRLDQVELLGGVVLRF